MRAEIIAIGTEITSGAKLDTNSQWLSLQLSDLGIPVHFHTTVADDLAANIDVLKIAGERADLVLITGGLGPTLDDLTREAMAAVAGVELVTDAASLQAIESYFRGRGREMPARNRLQAQFPRGAQPLLNPVGTAPGVWMELARPGRSPCLMAAMPGVPSEMRRMFVEQVQPRIPGEGNVIRRARLNCFGLGESAVEELLGDLTARGHDPEIGITAHEATITLRIIAQGDSEEVCQHKIATASSAIRARLGNYLFGVEDETLEEVVVREIANRGLNFVTIECGTAGLLADRVAHAPRAEECYRGGWVVSQRPEDWFQAAVRLHEETAAHYLLAIGPLTVTTDETGRRAFQMPIGLLGAGHPPEVVETNWSGNPDIVESRVTKLALDLLRQRLMFSK
ncbi:CinA family nicotinamide mononucleotide deamidase-related protein [Planctomicrobium sp. SH664]|uniref:CinA family nicotinamide mononucleotide deamidase-related protein n=1 Tax=Planctomicrobium sp. SH664 TaxID=3448125 RepID=UPI003F5B8077